MTITTSARTSTIDAKRPVWRAAALSGVVAAVSTASIAALAHRAGVSLDVDGSPIPVAGFATMTLAAVVIGYVLAVAVARWAARPRRAFTVTTLALTAASFIPDLATPMEADTRVLLIATHIVAAAIVIPAIARRLGEKR
ncbi:hypothetical protein BH09ACT10_BH09ACT10_31630 [soil metagenome]